MKKSIIALGVGAAAIGALLLSPKLAEAYRGDPNVQGPNYSEERHEAMTQAFENNDYNAWKEQMNGRGRVTQVVNESNFAKFAEAHKLMLEGKKDEAAKIRAELGLGLRDGSGRMNGGGQNRWNR